MSTLDFNCSACGKSFKDVKQELRGHRVKCGCGNVFRIGKKSDKRKRLDASKNKNPIDRRKSLDFPDLQPSIAKLEPEPILAEMADAPFVGANSGEADERQRVFLKEEDSGIVTAELDDSESELPDFTAPLALASPPPMLDQASQNRNQSMTIWRWLGLGVGIVCILLIGVLHWVLFIAGDPWTPQPGGNLIHHPITIGCVMLGTGSIMALSGFFGLLTGTTYSRFGMKIQGIDGRIHGFLYFSIGSLFLTSGTVWILKHL